MATIIALLCLTTARKPPYYFHNFVHWLKLLTLDIHICTERLDGVIVNVGHEIRKSWVWHYHVHRTLVKY